MVYVSLMADGMNLVVKFIVGFVRGLFQSFTAFICLCTCNILLHLAESVWGQRGHLTGLRVLMVHHGSMDWRPDHS